MEYGEDMAWFVVVRLVTDELVGIEVVSPHRPGLHLVDSSHLLPKSLIISYISVKI